MKVALSILVGARGHPMGVPGGVPLFEKEVAPFIKKPKILINPAGFITPWGCCFFFKVAPGY